MTAVATLHNSCHETVEFVAVAAGTGGDVIQLPDGRAGVVQGLKPYAIGDKVSVAVKGIFRVAKTASIALLRGGKAFFDRSAGSATYKQESGDFFVGAVADDAAGSATTVLVDLNVKPTYQVDLHDPRQIWTTGATDGLGVTQSTVGSKVYTLAFDTTGEVAMAALYSAETVRVQDGPIMEAKVAVFDIGNHAALDISFGLANGTNADADAIAQSVFFHLDGSALSILAESDDGTTEVNATDTEVDAVDDTPFIVWIDARDVDNVKLYINGIRVLSGTTFVLSAATGPLMALFHMEKTSDDTSADFRVYDATIRTCDVG